MTHVTLKKKAEDASVPLVVNLENSEGKAESYHYRVRSLSTRDLLKLQMEMSESGGSQEATQAASVRLLKSVISHITPEENTPDFMVLVEALDVSQLEALLKAVIEAATKGSVEV